MKIRRRYGSLLPRLLRARAFVFYPWIVFRYSREEMKALPPFRYRGSDGRLHRIPGARILFRHEWYHVEQVRRMGWLTFYAKWVWYSITLQDNKLEQEADANERTPMPAECALAFIEDLGP